MANTTMTHAAYVNSMTPEEYDRYVKGITKSATQTFCEISGEKVTGSYCKGRLTAAGSELAILRIFAEYTGRGRVAIAKDRYIIEKTGSGEWCLSFDA